MVEHDDGIIQMVDSVVGLASFTKFLSCISCGAQVKNGIGDCEKCLLKQKVDRCYESFTAKVLIERSDDNKEMKTVTLFNDAIRSAVKYVDVANQLLNLPPMEFLINSQNNNYCQFFDKRW